MKKYHLLLHCVFAILISCKKQEAAPATYMTVFLSGDSLWTANEVTISKVTADVVNITGRISREEYVTLTIRPFQAGKHSYEIYNTGIGVNLNKSSAYYMDHNGKSLAETGKINVTGATKKTISGSFSFSGNSKNISGTFTAPMP